MSIVSECVESCGLRLIVAQAAPFSTQGMYENVDLLTEIERRTGHQFRSQDLDRLRTVSDLEALLG